MNRQRAAMANGVIVEHDPDAPNDVRDTAIRESYDEVARQFRFEDTYAGRYALFLKNTKELNIVSAIAAGGAAPNLYIETLGDSDLNVAGVVGTASLPHASPFTSVSTVSSPA